MNEQRAIEILKPAWNESDIFTNYPAHWSFLFRQNCGCTRFEPGSNVISVIMEEPRYSVSYTLEELEAIQWWMKNKSKESK